MLRTGERFIVFLVLFFCASLAHAANCSNTNLSNGVICVQSSYTSNGGALQTVSATLNGVSASNVITIESHFCNGGPCSSTIVDTQTVADTGTSTCTKSSHSPLTLSNQRYYAWICTGLSSGTHTITLTTSGGDTTFYMDIHLAEWSGLNGTFDSAGVENQAVGTGTAVSLSTTGATGNAKDLIIGFLSTGSTVSAIGSGYTSINSSSIVIAETVTSTGTQTASWTITPSGGWGAIIVPLVITVGGGGGGGGGVTYFISPSGNDSNSGTSSGLPWLTPNHAVNCGDVLSAAAGTYSASNFQTGQWGTVTCAGGNNVAWLKCATFDACKIIATSSDGMWINKSFWGVQGWEISTNTTTVGACFHIGPTTNSTIIHHVILANNVANGCRGGGFTAYDLNSGASVDYIVYIGNVAYNAASGSGACYSGLNVYQPIASDTVAGTHIYVAGNFAYNNVDGNPCAGGSPTDGEGINLDTFDFSQGGGPVYTQQAVAQNNIAVSNGGRGVYAENNKAGGGANATIIFKYNTMYGNNKDANQGFCTGNGDLGLQAVFNSTATNNIAETDTANGCTGVAKWAMEMANANNTVFMNTNWLFSAAGNTIFTFNNGTGAPGSNHTGTSAVFTSTTIPGAPNCGSATSVPNCMATLISNFTPTASGASAYGYQIPSSSSIVDPLYPAWLCTTTNIPSGLVTPGCGPVSASPTPHRPIILGSFPTIVVKDGKG